MRGFLHFCRVLIAGGVGRVFNHDFRTLEFSLLMKQKNLTEEAL